MIYNQQEFDLRCEWGKQGVEQLAAISDVVIIVDVLSFTTCVEIATNNGAVIFPYTSHQTVNFPFASTNELVTDYAASLGAEVAVRRGTSTKGYSLSPQSLVNIPAGTKLVLPKNWV